MLGALFFILDYKIKNSYLRFLYIIYYIWLVGIIVRGFAFNFSFIKSFFFEGVGMLYFTPLFVLYPLNFTHLKKLFDVIFIMGILYILYNLVFINDLKGGSVNSKGMVEVFSDLSFPSGFILLTFAYHKPKKQIVALTAVLFISLMALINARRGLLLMYSNMFIVSFIMFTYFSPKKFMLIYLAILTGLLALLYASGVYKARSSKIFGSIVDRGTEDTRTVVELYFYDDMKEKDWIIGRGINGEYFCPDIEENQLTNYRSNIETGYLQNILKGGLVSLGLFVLIAVPAIFKGLFYSKNVLSKAAAFWILFAIINSYPTIFEGFTLKFILVWISIGICYSKDIREIKEKDMKSIFLQIP